MIPEWPLDPVTFTTYNIQRFLIAHAPALVSPDSGRGPHWDILVMFALPAGNLPVPLQPSSPGALLEPLDEQPQKYQRNDYGLEHKGDNQIDDVLD